MLRSAIKLATTAAYSSTLCSYTSFCCTHNLPFMPTPDTLSLYAVYMLHHIKLSSVNCYLTRITNALESLFPNVREARHHQIVMKTLQGCKKLQVVPTIHKRPITHSELTTIHHSHQQPLSHDDALFIALLMSGFHALLCLGEMVWPDKK